MDTAKTIFATGLQKPWIWAYLAALAVWLATIVFTRGTGGGEILTAAFTFAVFFAIVAIGQMFVITLGPGNIDLSVPATITLAGTVSIKLMDSQDSMILVGAAVTLGIGLGVGTFNYSLIRLLRIPPIIATLSSAFLFQSIAIAFGRGLRIKPPDMLADFTTARIGGMPVLALVIIGLAAIMSIVLNRTVYGRSVIAIGQSQRAALLTGIKVEAVRFRTYTMCAIFASLCGYLLSGFSGGASLGMGEEFLLASIAVVVIGGTSVAGGLSNVPGVWGAALFLFLLVNMLNTVGAPAGVRLIMTGLIIIAVVVVASGRRGTNQTAPAMTPTRPTKSEVSM